MYAAREAITVSETSTNNEGSGTEETDTRKEERRLQHQDQL